MQWNNLRFLHGTVTYGYWHIYISHTHTHTQVLFDHDGCLKKYSGVMEVLQEFYEVRLDVYRKRKEWLEGQLEAESSRLNNQARFIMEKIEGKVVVGE